MKIRLAVLLATSVALVGAVMIVTSAASPRHVTASGGGCPASYASGFFGYNGQGFDGSSFAPRPMAIEGEMFLNGDTAVSLTGTLSGFYTVNNRGTVSRVSFTGTYVMVAGECQGSATVIPSLGPTLHYDLVPTGWSVGGPGFAKEVLMAGTDQSNVGTIRLVPM